VSFHSEKFQIQLLSAGLSKEPAVLILFMLSQWLANILAAAAPDT